MKPRPTKHLPWQCGQNVKRDGWITLVQGAGDFFMADKPADRNTLAAIIGHGFFPTDDYDTVLAEVSEYGFGLEVLETDTEVSQ